MAKRKSSAIGNLASSSRSDREHLSVNIDDAENGYIVNASGSGNGNDYWSKRYIAKDRPEALKISSACLAGEAKSKKGKPKKNSSSKKVVLKRG